MTGKIRCDINTDDGPCVFLVFHAGRHFSSVDAALEWIKEQTADVIRNCEATRLRLNALFPIEGDDGDTAR